MSPVFWKARHPGEQAVLEKDKIQDYFFGCHSCVGDCCKIKKNG